MIREAKLFSVKSSEENKISSRKICTGFSKDDRGTLLTGKGIYHRGAEQRSRNPIVLVLVVVLVLEGAREIANRTELPIFCGSIRAKFGVASHFDHEKARGLPTGIEVPGLGYPISG